MSFRAREGNAHILRWGRLINLQSKHRSLYFQVHPWVALEDKYGHVETLQMLFDRAALCIGKEFGRS
jgi:hypothetical protein